MYSIGEFSKIGYVSTKTLRYYDEIGLLRPAYVDQENHYRYYSAEQVYEILFIAELKSYDLRLEQIKAILESKDKDLLEHFLKQRIEELDNQMQANLRLRSNIEKKVQQILLGGSIMERKEELIVEAKEFEPILVMSKSATIEITNLGSVIGSVFEDIFKAGLRPCGPVFTFYHDEEFNHDHANIEVSIQVEDNERAREIDQVKVLQPGLCAMCVYTGVYSKLGEAYAAILKWIEDNNYQIASSPFDAYMNSPSEVQNPEELITNVYFPIK